MSKVFLVYNENTQKTMTSDQVQATYGVNPAQDNSRLGVYHLTEQPVRSVQTYVREGSCYKPIYDYSLELTTATEALRAMEARLAALEQQE